MSRKPPFTGTGLNSAVGGLLSDAANLSGSTSTIQGGFDGRSQPTANGSGPRASQIKPLASGVSGRQIMKWLVPEQPLISMYINPKNVTYNYSKDISETRVKGGYSLQYWGEKLTTLTITGTTGTSGIEGINVLYDIYRNEQVMFDPYALTLAAERDKKEQSTFDNLLFGSDGILGLGSGTLSDIANVTTGIMNGGRSTNIVNSASKPTLASLAFTVELYWSGEIYRGYFTKFTVTESAESLGMFTYDIGFTVTQKRGYRTNFMPWHKNPTLGPSDWDNRSNLSYGNLTSNPGPIPNQKIPNIFDDIQSGFGKIGNNIEDFFDGDNENGSGILAPFFLP